VSQVRQTGGIVSKEYIRQAMRGGRHYQTVKQLRTRQFDDMRKITDATAASVSKVLRKAMADGVGPQEAARLINDRVAKVGITRGRLLARTELISAYNESSLNLYEDAGVKGVDLEPELLTAEDDRVCSICEDAAQETYTIDDARGVIPLHPNCRCAWAPMIIDGERIRL
jgi:SPP1 gp7 family putative phage head morphogenesis protein